MRALWRPLVVAAALNLIVVAAASAQTVVVTKAPPGATVEFVVNSALVGTVTADGEGRATFLLTPEHREGKTEADAYVFVEYCDNSLRRVILIEPGMQGYPGGQCPRREVPGAYIVRQTTTLVVNVSETAPSVLLRQGKAPAGWLTDEVDQPRREKPPTAPTRGLYLFGGGGVGTFANAAKVACGTGDCTGSTKPLTFSVGATFWATPYLGVEASYFKPGDITLKGGVETLYSYTSTLATNVITMVGKAGLPTSYVRIYGFGGATFSRADWDTLQTVEDQTVLVGDELTTVTGGTQSLKLFTQGWSWTAGAGFEVPVSKRMSIFGEGGRVNVSGDDRQGGEGKVDDRVLYLIAGIRVRILG